MVQKIIIPNFEMHLPRKLKKKIKKELEKKLKENPDLLDNGTLASESSQRSTHSPSEAQAPGQSAPSPENSGSESATQEQDTVGLDQFNTAIAQRDEYLNDLKRLQAEFDNYRKRVLKERAELKDFLIQDMMTRLLDVVSNLERALYHPISSEDVESYKTGVSMVYQQFTGILSDYGLSKINTVGQLFDPRFHEAVSQVESAEHEPGTIVMEIMPGYKINDRVLIAPKVQVAAKPTAPANPDGTSQTQG